MPVLIGIALKSLLIASLALGLLQLLKRRSAAERSWVAHVGLLMLAVVAFAPLALPSWTVESPALITPTVETVPAAQQVAAIPSAATPVAPALRGIATRATPERSSLTPVTAVTALYALPAATLLLITLLALVRLIALRTRADVLVDGHWLSALARAQRRMGFKHGTALLTSDELASPISWGVMRPVILLNSRAVEASGEAEAIIAHELAHVAQMDWVKLLLARIATALFWFNPLVWILAREAHQLREEAADDAVLAADISETDYAQLLVGVARHECPGLLLGAHGVAPSKNSLARRVARVLDGKSVRGPAARPFALGVLVGAVLVAGPLAAMTLTPAAAREAKPASGTVARAVTASPGDSGTMEVPADLGHIIANGVSASVATATAAIAPARVQANQEFRVAGPNSATVESANRTIVTRGPNGASVTTYPPDAQGRRRVIARSPSGMTAVTYVDAQDWENRHSRRSAIDTVIEMRAVGVTPEYAAAIRAASPALRNADNDDIIEMKAVGVTPAYAREMARTGFADLGPEQLKEARAVGVTADYMRAILATGLRPTMGEMVELHAMGVGPEDIRRSGTTGPLTRQQLRKLMAPRLRSPPPTPPRSPVPPGGWDPGPDDG